MSIKKKIITSLSVFVIMIVALIVGIVGIQPTRTSSVNNGTASTPSNVGDNANNNASKVEKPATYTYQANDIQIKKGADTLNFDYDPSVNMGDSASNYVAAYEYVFTSTMDETMGVNLHNIDPTGVNISYAYSDTQLDLTGEITTYTTYTTQTLPTSGNKYVYVFVSPKDTAIPVTFVTSIKWNYGKVGTVEIADNITGETITQNIIKGQNVYELDLIKPTSTTAGYYFDAWFLDSDFTQLAAFPIQTQGQPLYARFANLPQNVTTYTTFSNGSYSLTTDPNIQNLVIPTYYNDGTNGNAYITNIAFNAFTFSETLVGVTLPSSIITIEGGTFSDSSSVNSINLKSCVNLKSIGLSFMDNTLVRSIDLSNCTSLTSIGSYAFSGCNSLTDVLLPKNIISVGDYAFQECSNLTSIDLSNCTNLTSVEQYTFNNCSNLTNINLNNCTNLTTIGPSAFTGCNNLTSINLKGCNNLTTIGNSAFYNCGSLENIILPSGVTSIADNAFYGCASLETIDLSQCVNITSIGESAFRNCNYLTSITLPASVTTIGDNAFDGCSELINVTMPRSLTSIGNYAFRNCSALTSADMNNCTNLQTIGMYSFQNCHRLTRLDVSNSKLETIGNYAFQNCFGLTSIDASNSKLATIGDCAFQDCSGLTKLDLSNTNLTGIEQYIFSGCTNFVSIDLGNCANLKYIGYAVFQSNTKLKSVVLPRSLESISDEAFIGCTNLTNINLSDCVNLTSIGTEAFYNCDGLISITLPSGLTTIGGSAFAFCENVNSLNLDNCTNLETIGVKAFYNLDGVSVIDLSKCTSLTVIQSEAFQHSHNIKKVILPTSLTTIGDSAFNCCYSIAEVYNLSTSLTITKGGTDNGQVGYYAISIYTSLDTPSNLIIINGVEYYPESNSSYVAIGLANQNKTSITLDSRTTSIKPYAFYENTTLTSVDLSNCTNFTNIGRSAFDGCDNIEIAYLPRSLTTIEDFAFNSCNKLTSVGDLSQCTGLTYIGEQAFYYCESLTSINVPASLTTLGERAFQDTAITNMDLSKCTNMTSIPARAFWHCHELENVILPNSITSIGSHAFGDCRVLMSITIPTGVTSIGYAAFEDCVNLIEIYNLSTSLTITKGSTSNGYVGYYAKGIYTSLDTPSKLVTIDGVIYYPESDTSYTVITLVDKTLTNITLDSRTTSISQYAFRGNDTLTSVDLSNCTNLTSLIREAFYSCDSLTSVILPSSLVNIGHYAFEYCNSLTSVTLPNDLTDMGTGAFKNCSSLTSITIPSSVTSIGTYAFQGCGLTSITIPSSVTSIAAYAFAGCSSLTNIVIPRSMMNIGSYAFSGCTNLQTITFEDLGTWYRTASSAYTDGSIVDMTNPTQNATWLKGTDGYHNYYWYNGGNNLVLNANGGTFEGVSGAEDYEYNFEIEGGGTVTCPESDDDYYPNYGFTLGDDGYWISGNQYISDDLGEESYALARVTFTANAGDAVTFTVIHSGEEGCDYGILGYLDTELMGYPWTDEDYYYYECGGNTTYTITYTIETTGTHFIDIKYRKDSSADEGEDCLKFIFGNTIYDYTSGTTNVADGELNVATPVREGYTFVGWFTEAEGGTQVTYIDTTTTLYAHWREN